MPRRHLELLTEPPFDILSTLEKVDDAIDKNAEIAEAFLETGLKFAGLNAFSMENKSSFVTAGSGSGARSKPEWQGPVSALEQEKAHSTIRQLFRDWSAEGKRERDACYGPVLRALDEEFSRIPDDEKGRVRVLVPGSGLGRSCFEIARSGYNAMGNEISYHQMIATLHMLNRTTRVEQYELYPWAHDFSNHLTRDDQLCRVLVPDVHPGTELYSASVGKQIPAYERLSMESCDFCAEYCKEKNRESCDAVATIFFIDTAPNVLRYVEAVYNCLRVGGVWINLGPLKWHFENCAPGRKERKGSGDQEGEMRSEGADEMEDKGVGEPGSVELTNDEVVLLVEQFGFKVERLEVMSIETGYISNPRSMFSGTYRPSFWVARKVGVS